MRSVRENPYAVQNAVALGPERLAKIWKKVKQKHECLRPSPRGRNPREVGGIYAICYQIVSQPLLVLLTVGVSATPSRAAVQVPVQESAVPDVPSQSQWSAPLMV